MSVIDDLKKIGGKPLGDAFSQDAFRTHDVLDNVTLTSGYCAGVVLDWTRRVLQSGPGRQEKYLSYSTPNYSTPERKVATATLKRMAAAYDGQAPSYVGETNKTATLNELRKLKLLPVESYDAYGTGVPVLNPMAQRLVKYWQIPGTPNGMFGKFNLKMKIAGVLAYKDIDTLIDNLTATPDAQYEAGSTDGRDWATFAAELDTKFRKNRIADRRKDPNRLFGNLKVVDSSPAHDYESAGHWSHKLRTEGFRLNCCTTVSFKPTGGGNGHQIAVHQTGNDDFVFFDPNYGAFQFSAANLKGCFQHLFWATMIDDPKALDGTKAVYLRRKSETAAAVGSWNRMGYTIFARK
jgi:hypothetical protein